MLSLPLPLGTHLPTLHANAACPLCSLSCRRLPGASWRIASTPPGGTLLPSLASTLPSKNQARGRGELVSRHPIRNSWQSRDTSLPFAICRGSHPTFNIHAFSFCTYYGHGVLSFLLKMLEQRLLDGFFFGPLVHYRLQDHFPEAAAHNTRVLEVLLLLNFEGPTLALLMVVDKRSHYTSIVVLIPQHARKACNDALGEIYGVYPASHFDS